MIQLYVYMCSFLCRFFSHISYHRILSRVPCAKLFPGGSEVKVSACNAGDLGLIPGSGRSPGEGNGNPVIPWREEPGGLQSMGSQRVGHN